MNSPESHMQRARVAAPQTARSPQTVATSAPKRDVGLMLDCDGLSFNTELPQRSVLQALILELFGIETSPLDFAWALGASKEATIRGFDERYGRCPFLCPQDLKPRETVGAYIVRRLIEIRRPQERAGIDLTPMPGLPELLDFADNSALPRSISTSRPEADAREIIQSAKLSHRFHAVIGKDSDGVTEPKPAPDIFIRSARALNIRISESWALEDSTPGVQSARAAGARVLYIPDLRVANPCPTARRLASHTAASLEDAVTFLERELGR